MSLSAPLIDDEGPRQDIQLAASNIDWQMLDKSRFFFLGAALFSGVSGVLYPVVVLKTRQQVCESQFSCFRIASRVLRYEGLRGLYRGFGTSLMGTIPARALYMTALEITKSEVGSATTGMGFKEGAAAAIANGAAGLSAAMAAQVVWTPVDVVSQRLMVQEAAATCNNNKYVGGIDAFRKIMNSNGVRGLYRGFGMSILTYAPSNAVWWASYAIVQRLVWDGVGDYEDGMNSSSITSSSSSKTTVMGVQGFSAAIAGGVSALITMPLDTIKTRLQVLDHRNGRKGGGPTVVETVRKLVREGGLMACYRGLGPRWASMSISSATMITTYEYLKRLSAKNQDACLVS